MGYKDYAKDYEIEHRARPDGRKPKAVRIYVGPYYVFKSSPERIAGLRLMYTALLAAVAVLLLIPMCIDCVSTRTWYVQLPAAVAVIPLALALCALFNLWTAKGRMERSHYEGLYNRMSGSCFFLMLLSAISTAGGLLLLIKQGISLADAAVLCCNVLLCVLSAFLYAKRRGLEARQVENPEKPQAKKK